MMRHDLGLAILLCGLCVSPAAAGSKADVTYVANEGFLIEIQGKKILVDALFHDDTIDWCHVPGPETRRRMEEATGPFEGVDLILITHGHVDHFDPDVVLRHLASNPEAIAVGPPQAISRLRTRASWKKEFDERIRATDLDLFATTEMTVRGIRLEAHRIRHGAYMIKDRRTGEPKNKHETVENLAFIVEVGGVTFMHLGDAFLRENRDYFEGPRFRKRQIDLLFMEEWSDETLTTMRASLHPRKVVFMHLPPQPEKIERLVGYLTSEIPEAVVFRAPMESRSF